MSFALPALLLADYDGHMDWDGGWGVAMAVGMFLFWAVVIAAIIWLVREVTSTRNPTRLAGSADDPLRILDQRLADGSISPDEYRERRATLAERDP